MEIIQMSPLDAAEHIAAFIAQTIKTYETEQLGQKPFNVFPGIFAGMEKPERATG